MKITNVKLDLLTDIDQHLFIESGIRGGVSTICHRYAKSNVRGEAVEHLIYWDANNLYGWAMSQYLPTGDFKWMSDEEISKFKVSQISDENQVGYILEVDLDYPEELHDHHSDYPLAPERLSVKSEDLSPFQLKC